MERYRALFKKLFESQPYPVTVHDSGCHIIYANQSAISRFKVEPAAEVGARCYLSGVCGDDPQARRYCANRSDKMRATRVFEPSPGRTLVRISIPIGGMENPGGAINIYRELEAQAGAFSSDAAEPIVLDDFLESGSALCMPMKPLTRKEQEVLGWLMQGKLSSEISAIMGISENTVNYHMKNIFGKLGAENRTHAASLGYKRELEKQRLILREMHHRVKNNFAILSGLISLKRRQVTSQDAMEALSWVDTQARTFSAFHRLLMEAGDCPTLPMDKLLSEALKHIGAQIPPAQDVSIVRSLQHIRMRMDIAMPLVQIVNELIVNALKHAFAGAIRGMVEVRLMITEDGRHVQLVVEDDGAGLPDGFSLQDAATMGMRIVHSLVSQVGGRCEVGTGPGARFTITIPHDEVEN